MSFTTQLLLQTAYYSIVLIFGLLIISFLQRGYFWKFIRVKTSFGKLILVKIRAVNRDYFRVGRIEDGFLVYKFKKQEKRIAIKDSSVFYRALGVLWVDVDEVTNNICKTDYTTIAGYDAGKLNDLYLRALYRPTIADNQDRIIMGGLLLIIIGLVALGIFIYFMYNEIALIKGLVENLRTV